MKIPALAFLLGVGVGSAGLVLWSLHELDRVRLRGW